MGINLFGIAASKAGANCIPLDCGKARVMPPKSAAAVGEHTDTVTISPEGSLQRDAARMSGAVMGGIRASEGADAQRVKEIKAQVAGNTYYVSAGAVADAMISRACGA